MFLHNKTTKKISLIAFLILFLGGLYFYLNFSSPSDETVKREYLDQYPNTEFVSTEMIFDWEPKRAYTYLVKFKQPPNEKELSNEFTIKQSRSFQWRWCSDQTERKCD